MSSDSFKYNAIHQLFAYKSYKQDLALNNPQGLISEDSYERSSSKD